MSEEKVFAKGLYFKSRQLEFGQVIAMSVKAQDFIDFINAHTNESGYCNIDIMPQKKDSASKNSHYAVLNTWVPDSTKAKATNTTTVQSQPPSVFGSTSGQSDDLPF